MKHSPSTLEVRAFFIAAAAVLAAVGYVAFDYATQSGVVGGYAVTDDQVYFFDTLVYGADPKSFTTLPYDYAKDNQFVYYDGRIVPGADPDSFTVIGPIMAKDNEAVYVYDRVEPLLNPATVLYLGNYYTKQGDEIHYKGRPTSIDASTIEILPFDFAAKDKEGVYVAGKLQNL